MRKAVFLAIFLSGCGQFRAMSNEQIVKQVKFCESNGLHPMTLYSGWTYEVVAIQCVPKDQK